MNGASPYCGHLNTVAGLRCSESETHIHHGNPLTAPKDASRSVQLSWRKSDDIPKESKR